MKKVIVNGTEFIFSSVKGNAEKTFREGDVNITPANIGTYSSSEIDKLISDLNSTISTLKSTIEEQNKFICNLNDLSNLVYLLSSDGSYLTTSNGDQLVNI